MRILVTGSEGTLGQPLCRELEKRGHEVFRSDLMHHSYDEDAYCRTDIRQAAEVARLFGLSRPEVVYHLAAEFGRRNGEEYYERCWETNVIGTRHIASACERVGARLLFASSSEIYGDLPQPLLHESHATRFPLRHSNDYAESKWVGENIIRRMAERTRLEYTILRFFNAYGPGERPTPYRSVVSLFLWNLLRDRPIKVYEGYHRAFMYIDDFTPTLATASEAFRDGETINIGGAEYRSVEDLARLCLKETQAPESLVTYLPQEVHNVRNKRPDIERARHVLGHDPQVTLEEGVPLTAEYIREHLSLHYGYYHGTYA